jgi:hypothetical protein
MRMVALIAMLTGPLGLIGSAHAHLTQSFRLACAGSRLSIVWCPDQISKEGWTLKYKTESPQDLMDAYWRYEVWTREKMAIVCVQSGGRGGMRINSCKELSEVDR